MLFRSVIKIRRLAYPYMLWMVVFTLAPLLLVAFYAFTAYDEAGALYLTLDGFRAVFSMEDTVALDLFNLNSSLGIDWQVPIYVNVFAKSLQIALVSTLVCLLIGYPAAYILAQQSKKSRRGSNLMLFLFVMPMWMNALLRTYAWLALLEPRGIINTFLGYLNIGPIQFLYNDFGIGLGMVYNYLPFMVLPIHSVLVKISPSVVEAAEDLGANGVQTFWHITLPLLRPILIIAGLVRMIDAFKTFDIIYATTEGGPGTATLTTNIYTFLTGLRFANLGYAASLSLVMLLISLVLTTILGRSLKRGA